MKIAKYIFLIVLALLAWTAFINFGIHSGFLIRPITSENSPSAFIEATQARLENVHGDQDKRELEINKL